MRVGFLAAHLPGFRLVANRLDTFPNPRLAHGTGVSDECDPYVDTADGSKKFPVQDDVHRVDFYSQWLGTEP